MTYYYRIFSLFFLSDHITCTYGQRDEDKSHEMRVTINRRNSGHLFLKWKGNLGVSDILMKIAVERAKVWYRQRIKRCLMMRINGSSDSVTLLTILTKPSSQIDAGLEGRCCNPDCFGGFSIFLWKLAMMLVRVSKVSM